MAAAKRPYFIRHRDVEYMIVARSPAEAIADVVGPEIQDLRPATAQETLVWAKAGKPTREAGEPREKAEPPAEQVDNTLELRAGDVIQPDGAAPAVIIGGDADHQPLVQLDEGSVALPDK